MSAPRRLRWFVAVAAALASLAIAASAHAHPLGNFSINHLTVVRVSSDRVELRYILDQAEIPTFQERGLSAVQVLARKETEVARRLRVLADGRVLALRPAGAPLLSHPPGQAGLPLTRLELLLGAPLRPGRHRVEVLDGTFPGRVGWKAVVTRPGSRTAVRSSVPSTDPTGGLRHYPRAVISSPLDERVARLAVAPGHGTVVAPRGLDGPAATQAERAGDGFASVFSRAVHGRGALVLLFLAAFAWGAAHALSPGHGKGMVAAYLVGTRGRPRDAVMLGTTVTITHTAGVFALGGVTLALSQLILPEQLYPWLTLASGLLVVGVGLTVLRSRVRTLRARRAHDHAHAHGHGHGHDHAHDVPERLSARGLIALGASAGLLPCPSALVVLLAALSQHRVGLGLALIVVFSLGLACTLTALGLAVVGARRAITRLPVPQGAVAVLPTVSTIAILGLGLALTVRALPGVV